MMLVLLNVCKYHKDSPHMFCTVRKKVQTDIGTEGQHHVPDQAVCQEIQVYQWPLGD